MGIVAREFDCEELHPIDIVETLAEERSWDFDRIADRIVALSAQLDTAVTVEGEALVVKLAG